MIALKVFKNYKNSPLKNINNFLTDPKLAEECAPRVWAGEPGTDGRMAHNIWHGGEPTHLETVTTWEVYKPAPACDHTLTHHGVQGEYTGSTTLHPLYRSVSVGTWVPLFALFVFKMSYMYLVQVLETILVFETVFLSSYDSYQPQVVPLTQ